MNKNNIEKIFYRFNKLNPNPKTDLKFKTKFELLISVILSAQATDKSVNKVTKELFKNYNTPEKISKLGESRLKKKIKTIGLFNEKAKNIILTSKILKSSYNSRVPSQFKELIKLPGVGRKTANVVLNEGFGKPTIAVDTHIFRVSHRLNLSNGKTPDLVENDLIKVIPDKYKKKAHMWLILHGRYTCVARSPKCNECIIKKYCSYRNE